MIVVQSGCANSAFEKVYKQVLTEDLNGGTLLVMDTVTISQLKMQPSKVIARSLDYPVAVEKRNEVKAYLIGKELYEKVMRLLEDYVDKAVVKKTNFSKGRDFEAVAKELGI